MGPKGVRLTQISLYMLIYAFFGGVTKDREASFSRNYVCLKNFKNLRSYVITCCFLSASVAELSFNLIRLK